MKKLLAVALCLALVCLAFAGCGSSESKNVIKIGIFEPASGDNAAGGKQEVLGIRYANSVYPTVKINGVDYTIELEEVDNQTTADKAGSAAQTLVSKGVSVILGTYGSGAAMAGGVYFEEAKIPAIGCSCTNPGVTSDNEYYFRVCYLDPFQGTVMANNAYDAGCRKAYVLTQLGDDYSTGLGNYFVEGFKKLGGEVVEEQFPEGTTNYASYIANATAAGADVMFAPTSTTVAALLIEQAATSKVSYKIMAGDTWESSVILDAAKGTGLDIEVSTFFDENDKEASSFVDGFKAWLNADADRLTNNGGNDIVAAVTALGYDSYLTAIKAIEMANSTDGTAIRDALTQINSADNAVKGVTGIIYFDNIGDAVRDMAYIKIANTETGLFEFKKTQTVK